MPTVKLGTKAVGSIVTLKVKGSPRNFIVVQQGRPASGNYDTSFDNVTWLLMQDIYDQRQWDGSYNDYAKSSIHAWLNNASSGFLSLLDADIRAVIPTVKIPYRPSKGTSSYVASGADGLACKAFLLSMLEVGLSPRYSPREGATLTYFTSNGRPRRVAYYNGSPYGWWTRSPLADDSGWTNVAYYVATDGTDDISGVNTNYGCRPALTLPSNLYVSDDGSILTNEPPTAPGSIDVTAPVAGQPVTVTLTAATDPDGTIASYRYERQVDDGNWTQFASTSSLSVTDSINDSWTTVTYRAKAVDNMGAEGPYATSRAYTVMHNQPPTAPGSINVTNVVSGQKATITLTAATDPDGTIASYRYERQVDDGNWTQFASTSSLSVTDSINASWTTVTYRAKAVDNEGAQGPYATSRPYIVMHNQPPTAPGSINAINVVGGQTATIIIREATDPDGAIANYVYERNVDDSSHWDVIATTSALSTTDHISSEWGTVAYRAKAVDDDGASGPYVTSEQYAVNVGWVLIGGPSTAMGQQIKPFTLSAAISVSGQTGVTGITVTGYLDGKKVLDTILDQGENAEISVDTRVLASGQHTIQIQAEKAELLPANKVWQFAIPFNALPDGGRAEQLWDENQVPIFPRTTSQMVFCQGGTLADVLAALQGGSAAPLLEPVIKEAPPSGSYALSPGVLYDFTQANASALTFTFEAPAAGKAAAYHVMFKCGGTAATVTLPDGVKTPDGYVIEANRVYELSILQNMLAYQSWGAS